MGDQTQTEIKAQEFLREYEGIAKLEDAPPLALNRIARDGTLIAIELVDEVTDAGHLLAHTYRTVTALAAAEAEPKRIAAVEARIPRLKETYERKLDLSNRLGELTDRAMALAEVGAVLGDPKQKPIPWEQAKEELGLEPVPPATGVGEAFAAMGSPETTDNKDGTYTHTWGNLDKDNESEPGEVKITPIRKWPLWDWLFR